MTKPNDRLAVAVVRAALDYDEAAGTFRWKHRASATAQWNGKFSGRPAGTINDRGYLIICLDGVDCRAHRLAWAIKTGQWPEGEIDHRDQNKANNRWDNLRPATHAQNNYNKGPQSNNKSGFKGVSYSRTARQWVAMIMANGEHIVVGKAPTAEEASVLYEDAARKYHGEFAGAMSRKDAINAHS